MSGVINNLLEKLHLSNSSGEPPKEPEEQDLKQLREQYAAAKQEHVFYYYDSLGVAEKADLFEQLVKIDPKHVNDLAQKTLKPTPTQQHESTPKLEPLPEQTSASVMDSDKDSLDAWTHHGVDLIAHNKVAVVLMAGGQGTRLGSSAPKGCFNIGLPSGKSLFQLQAERILKLQELAAHRHGKESVVIPWYVMTSGPTRQPTQDFFAQHKYFGLSEDNVFIFEQGVLPCISNDGKILMDNKSKVGTGSSYGHDWSSICSPKCNP